MRQHKMLYGNELEHWNPGGDDADPTEDGPYVDPKHPTADDITHILKGILHIFKCLSCPIDDKYMRCLN